MISDDMGCSVDALSYLDKECSGKTSCEYVSPGLDLYEIRCTKDFASRSFLYLETDYDCIEGKRNSEMCTQL